LLDHDYIITDSAKYIIFDDRLPTPTQPNEAWFNDQIPLASLVRSNMKRYLSHKYTRGQSTLIVYLLDPEIEKILSEGTSHKAGKKGKIPLYESQCNKILEAIRAEVGTQPALTSIPAILTTIDVRPHLRKITALEFPRLPILSYGELSPDLNIQPIARISLDN
jgi:type III secretion protein V